MPLTRLLANLIYGVSGGGGAGGLLHSGSKGHRGRSLNGPALRVAGGVAKEKRKDRSGGCIGNNELRVTFSPIFGSVLPL